MAHSMKAARIHKYGDPLILEEIPIPKPNENQILIKIISSGVCHTDLHVAAGDMPGNPILPFIPGHELVGQIFERGKNVNIFKDGDIVGIPSLHWACGTCEFCTTGWETLCHKQLATGYSVDGGFAEYTVAPADFAVPIPDGTNLYEIAPILCAGVTTYKGLKMTKAKKGEWLIISGIGGLGHVAIQYAKAMGFMVAAVDISDDKIKLAKNLGADLTVNASNTNAVEEIHKEIGGAHAVLVTAASASAFTSGVKMLRRGGTCVLNGLPPGDFPLPICDVVLAGQSVVGSIIGTRKDMDEALAMAIDSNIKVTISKYKLEDINEIFKKLKSGKIIGRAVLDLK